MIPVLPPDLPRFPAGTPDSGPEPDDGFDLLLATADAEAAEVAATAPSAARRRSLGQGSDVSAEAQLPSPLAALIAVSAEPAVAPSPSAGLPPGGAPGTGADVLEASPAASGELPAHMPASGPAVSAAEPPAGPGGAAPPLPQISAAAALDPAPARPAPSAAAPLAAPSPPPSPQAASPGPPFAITVDPPRPDRPTKGADAAASRSLRPAGAAASAPALAESAGPARLLAPVPLPLAPAPSPGSQGLQTGQTGPEWTDSPPEDPASFSLPDSPAEAAETAPPSGHVVGARLAVGSSDRLLVTLAAASAASRDLLERETGQLAADLSAAGARVEAIRVDLAPRVNPDGRGDAAGGQHPGPGQGGGAPWEPAPPQKPAALRQPDVPGEHPARGAGQLRRADGGKVDRYA